MWRGETRFPTHSWPELSEEEDKLYRILVPENKSLAINLNDFSDLYGQQVVEKDKKLVAERESGFQRRDAADPESQIWIKRGELFEAIVNDQIEQSEWMSSDASVIVPSRYDDIENGVDSIIEFDINTGRSHLALAVDLTKSTKQLDKKFEAIKSSIKMGRLSRIKYFQSKDFRGELTDVPRVVIGADEKTVQEIAEHLLTFKVRQKHPSAERVEDFWRAEEALKNHYLQFQILEEILAQLKAFAAYAEKSGQEQLVEKYKNVINIISRVMNERKKSVEPQRYKELQSRIDNDSTHMMIMEKTESFA